MKRSFTLFLFSIAAFAGRLAAQPVLTNSLTSVPLGTVDSAYGASPTVLPGAGGANVTWDMSSLTTVFAAKLTVVDPTTTPYTGTFSSATFCTKIESATGTSYNYNKQSATGVENLSLTYAGAGIGTDFSPNPRLSVPFTFHYLDSRSDTFQSTVSGPDTVRLTYDGYGSLKTPFYTYPNVIRIKEDYGTSTSYSWYTVNPFMLVMNYASTTNNYVIVTSQFATTGVCNIPVASTAAIYPNPMSETATLKMNTSGYKNASVVITEISGKVVKQIPLTSSETTIPKGDLNPGLYFYTIQNDGQRVANGKLLIQ
jgi:hypothetical protein